VDRSYGLIYRHERQRRGLMNEFKTIWQREYVAEKCDRCAQEVKHDGVMIKSQNERSRTSMMLCFPCIEYIYKTADNVKKSREANDELRRLTRKST
jgi:hypothetical protein